MLLIFCIIDSTAALCESTASSGSDCQDHLLKILCPSAVAGSIIGRGGSVINQLNQMTGAKIKVSQNGEFFPTTNDRVLAISGSMTAISAAIHELVTKMIEVSLAYYSSASVSFTAVCDWFIIVFISLRILHKQYTISFHSPSLTHNDQTTARRTSSYMKTFPNKITAFLYFSTNIFLPRSLCVLFSPLLLILYILKTLGSWQENKSIIWILPPCK